MNETKILNNMLTEAKKKQKLWIKKYLESGCLYAKGIVDEATATINMLQQQIDALNDGWISVNDFYPEGEYVVDLGRVAPSRTVMVKFADGCTCPARWNPNTYMWLDLSTSLLFDHDEVVAWCEVSSLFDEPKPESKISEPELNVGEAALLKQYKATNLAPEMIKMLQEYSISVAEENAKLHELIEAYEKYGAAIDFKNALETIDELNAEIITLKRELQSLRNLEELKASPYWKAYTSIQNLGPRKLIQLFDYSDKHAIMYRYSPEEIYNRVAKEVYK